MPISRRYGLLRCGFLVLAIIGVAVPYAAFIPFILDNGLNLPLIIEQAGENRIAAFAWLDVIVSAAALLVAAFSREFITFKQALVVTVLTCLAGVSAGLPMLFYFAIKQKRPSSL